MPASNPLHHTTAHLAALVTRIAQAATAFLAAAFHDNPAQNPLQRILELCAILVARLSPKTPRPKRHIGARLKDVQDLFDNLFEGLEDPYGDVRRHFDAYFARRARRASPGASAPSGLSTQAIIAEIRSALAEAATLLGHPLPEHLEDLCRQATSAAQALEHPNHPPTPTQAALPRHDPEPPPPPLDPAHRAHPPDP